MNNKIDIVNKGIKANSVNADVIAVGNGAKAIQIAKTNDQNQKIDIDKYTEEDINSNLRKYSPTVFISYCHDDFEIAERLSKELKKNKIDVIIDRFDMQAGRNIRNFIDTSIRDSQVTISIVSNKSLSSAWVALESIESFYHEKYDSEKMFIACYIDDDFFDSNFRLNTTKKIDAMIADIDEKIIEYIELKIDTNDLNNQKSRLYFLRNNLGDIILRLKESLCLDLRNEKFSCNVEKIVRTIRSKNIVF